MEIELKFLVKDEFVRDKILQDKHLESICQKGSQEEIQMKAIYLDTENLDLCKKEMALRVRFENGAPIATLKWGGGSEGGLHVRSELNVPVDHIFLEKPHLDIFKGSEIYYQIMETAGDRKLIPLMEMNCLRKQMMVDTGRSISVVSLDVGEIVTPKGTAPISELEIELYSGDREDMVALGRELIFKYNLEEGLKSKFQVGLELMGL